MYNLNHKPCGLELGQLSPVNDNTMYCDVHNHNQFVMLKETQLENRFYLEGTSNGQIGQRFSALENKNLRFVVQNRKNCLLRPQGVAKNCA